MSRLPQVTVTYEDPYGLAGVFLPLLKSRLPLTQLHWKSSIAVQAPVKTIAQLDCRLIPFAGATEQQHQYASLQDQPTVNLFLVQCEDGDAYKAQVRNQIRTWFNAVAGRKGQEWIIIHCVSARSETNIKTGPKLLGLRNSVIDRIRSDFNSSTTTRDQCCRINLAADQAEIDSEFAELVVQIKACILSSLDKRIADHQERIANMEAQRNVPGWNFCTYFILKEGLIDTFEQFSLYEESLAVLDELEATFIELQEAGQLEHFAAPGTLSVADAQSAIPDITIKPYRQAILQNQSTLLDFCTYLFSRQAAATRHCQRSAELFKRALQYVSSLARHVEANADGLPWLADTWSLTSIASIIKFASDMPAEGSAASARADLQCLYRTTLLSLYTKVQGDSSLLEILPDSIKSQLTDDGHIQAQQDLINDIIKDYQDSGRDNSAAIWIAELARIHAGRDNWQEVVNLLSTIPESISKLNTLCDLYLTAWQKTGNMNEYMYAILDHAEQLKGSGFKQDYLQQVSELARDNGRPHLEWPAEKFLTASLSKYPRTSLTAIEATLSIDWLLHVAFGQCDVVVTLLDVAGHPIELRDDNVIMKPGMQKIRLSTNDIRPGFYKLSQIQIIIGKLQISQDEFSETVDDFSIPVYSDIGLSLSIHRPRKIHVRHTIPSVALNFESSVALDACLLRLVQIPELPENITLTQLATGESVEVSGVNGEITFSLPASTLLELTIPYDPSHQVVRLDVQLKYVAQGIEATWTGSLRANIGLPLAVDVQDYFRATHLLSKFKVASNVDRAFIISEATFAVEKTGELAESPQYSNLLVAPGHATHLLYKIQASTKSRVFDLILHYRTPEEELSRLVREALVELGQEYGAYSEEVGMLWQAFCEHQKTLCNLDASLRQKQFVFASIDENFWDQMLQQISPLRRQLTGDMIKALLSKQIALPQDGPKRSMRISVDIPAPQVVHTIHIEPSQSQSALNTYLPAKLRITASTLWVQEPQDCKYWFEVQVDESAWLFVGKRRGELTLTDGQFEMEIGLIPMVLGLLSLPKVDVFSLDLEAVNEMHETSRQIQVISDKQTQEETIDLGLIRTVVAA